MTELKPCPFCGGVAHRMFGPEVWIECTECQASSCMHCNIETAEEDWNRRVEAGTSPLGYCPHNGQMSFSCGRCGCRTFKSYPQTVPADRSKGWTYEYACTNCGQIMGLTLKGRDDER